MQTEKAKSSHFDRTRGDKNQIFRTSNLDCKHRTNQTQLESRVTFNGPTENVNYANHTGK